MDKLIGVLITALAEVDQVSSFSTAVSFIPQDGAEVVQYLDAIDNRMVPIIFIDQFLTHEGSYVAGYSEDLAQALTSSSHYGRIVLAFDEPMLRASRAGQPHAQVLQIMGDVKRNYPGTEIMHIEAYSELYRQYVNNDGQLTLFYDAEHIGFDCYGQFGGCGGDDVPKVGQFLYLNEINKAIIEHGSEAKLFLVPGTFTHPEYTTHEAEVVMQLELYYYFMRANFNRISGLGGFTWGDLGQFIGAGNNPTIRYNIETNFPKLTTKGDDFKLILD